MMYAPVPSKLSPPQTKTPLIRKHLIRRLEVAPGRKLTVIQGRAAQGKTTLAATYAARSKFPTAWINLGPEDSDPASLYHVLVRALTPLLYREDPMRLLAYPSLSFGPRHPSPMFREWSAALFERTTGPLQIILDGADRMLPDAPSWVLIQALLETLPENFHLFVLSREMPDIAHGRSLDRSEIQILSDQDLAFSVRETKTFLRKNCGIDLTAEELDQVHGVTGGWVGGLIMLSGKLSSGRRCAGRHSLDGKVVSAFQTTLNCYFDETVFDDLPEDLQVYLLKTSILDELGLDLLDHLFPETDNSAVIRSLVDRNLFIETYAQQDYLATYRFHNLFRDFLSYKRGMRISEEDIRVLCMESGRFFERQKRHITAARFYLKARAFPQAVALIECFGTALLKEGRHALLTDMLTALPEEMREQHPWLLLFTAIMARFTEADRNIDRLWKAYRIFETRGSLNGRLLCMAFLLEATTLRGRDVIPLPGLLTQAEEIGNAAGAEAFDQEKALLWLHTGFALTIRGGEPRKGLVTCQKASLFAAKANDPILQFNALVNAGIAATWLGEFEMLANLVRDLEALADRIDHPELDVVKEVMLSEMHLFRGDILSGKRCIDKCAQGIADMGLVYLTPPKLYSDFLLAFYSESHTQAQNIAAQLAQICTAMDHPTGLALAVVFQGADLYWEGCFEAAGRRFHDALAIYREPGCGSALHENWAELLLALTELHRGRWGAAESRMQSALRYFRRIQSHTFIVEALLALGLLHIRRGLTQAAQTCLDEAFGLAERQGIFHLAIMRPVDAIEVCSRALEMDLDRHRDYVARLLTCKYGRRAIPALAEMAGKTRPGVRRKILDIRKAIRTQTMPRITIRTLGHFNVYRHQAPITDAEWKGSRSKDFLKALISRGGRGVPKELIIDDLWPDSKASGEGTFKASLHRLRKALEPDMEPQLGSLYIILQENQVSLNFDLFEVDAFRFLELCAAVLEALATDRLKEAGEWFEAARQIYQGDFLPSDRYAPWAEPMRRRLSVAYCDLLARGGDLYERRGAMQKACRIYRHLLEAEPLDETACRKLMGLHARRGQTAKAIQIYESYCRRLEADLGVKPDPALAALHQGILDAK